MYEATRQRIGEIIGEASMCWSETPKGVFNSERAAELVDEIMTHIQYPLEHPDDKKNNPMTQSISEELNQKFFGGIPTQEMGSAQVDEEELLDFIQSKISQAREETAQDFADWLHKKGYIDSDYYTEDPKAVEAFLSEYKK